MNYQLFLKYSFIIIITIILLYLAIYLFTNKEYFTSGYYQVLFNTIGDYPISVDKPILNSYPLINKNTVSNDTYEKIWWRFPIFSLPSFKQITNNLRYHYNPDEGTCIPSDFCGALYHSKDSPSNYVFPAPEAQTGEGARVGYFRTEPNVLYFSIPTNENILY
jgi:hypothetical protein